jgi:hypothetical protein
MPSRLSRATSASSSTQLTPWSIRSTPDVVQALPDVADRVGLVDVAVHGEAVARLAGAGEDLLELDRGVIPLVGVQAHSDDLVAVRQGLLEGLRRGIGGHVAQEAHDELDAQAESGLRVQPGAVQPADHGLERYPAAGVGLGIEEDLGVDHVLGAGPAEVRHGQVVEVLLGQQYRHALVVGGQERGQVGEGIAGPHAGGGDVGQADPVARRQLEFELRLQGALEVQVQFRLGQPGDEGREFAHGRLRPG